MAASVAWSEPVSRAPDLEQLDPAPVGPAMAWPLQTSRASIASNGGTWFAVWSDGRAGNLDVFGTRIEADGTIADPLGIPIAPTYAQDVDPVITAHGDGYVVAWTSPLGVFLVSVARDGRILDGGAIAGTEGMSIDAGGTAIASNGTDIVVAWTEYDPFAMSQTAFFTVVEATRNVKVRRRAIPRVFGGQFSPAAASSGGRFVLAWTELEWGSRREVFAMDVESESPTRVRELAPAAPESAIALVPTPSGYLIATGGIDVQVRRLDAMGRPLGSAVAIPGDEVTRVDPAMTPVPGGVLLACTERPATTTEARFDEIAQVRLDLVGNLIGPVTQLVSAPGGQESVSLASTADGRVFAVWRDGRDWGEFDGGYSGALFGRLVRASGLAMPEAVVARGPSVQYRPAVTAGPGGFLVTWTEQSGVNSVRAFASLIRSDGSIAKANIEIAALIYPNLVPYVVATASEDGYLLAWASDEGLNAVRMTSAGEILDSPPIRFGFSGIAPSIASDGRDFLVTWTRRDGAGSNPRWDFVTSAVTRDGVVVDPEGTFVDCCGGGYSSVSFAGDKYLVTWTVGVSKYFDDVHGRFVSVAGMPLTPAFPLAGSRFAVSLSSAAGSEGTLVNWGPCRRMIPSGGSVPGVAVECDHFGDGAFDPDPYTAWTGRIFMLSGDPVAVHDDSRAIVVATRPVKPLPQAHDGEVQRVFFGTFDVGRARPVRR
ncbi:MAG: hypothetical protein ACSLFQ_07230 [Thermoanaerobaculia bacterium]